MNPTAWMTWWALAGFPAQVPLDRLKTIPEAAFDAVFAMRYPGPPGPYGGNRHCSFRDACGRTVACDTHWYHPPVWAVEYHIRDGYCLQQFTTLEQAREFLQALRP